MTKQIPNMITSLNILCGSVAILFAVSGDLITAAVFVFLGIFFDFFDGLAARLLHAQSEIGLQLDSLADVITSGLAPAVVMFQLLNMSFTGEKQQLTEVFSDSGWNVSFSHYVPLFGLMIVVGAAYRLAKFNVDDRQTDGFIGLPTPANALLVLSFPLILEYQNSDLTETLILNPWFLIGITLLGCILMNAELRLFALKFKTYGFKENKIRYIFLILCLLLMLVFKYWSVPLIIGIYLLLSIFEAKQKIPDSYS